MFVPKLQTQADIIAYPDIDTLDAYVNSAQNISLQKSFDVIQRVIIDIYFQDNTQDYDQWGTASALTNGWDIRYQFNNGTEISLYDGIYVKDINDLRRPSFDFDPIIDSSNPEGVGVSTRYSFNKFSPLGLDNRTGLVTSLFIMIQDNVQTGIEEFWITFEGYNIFGETDKETETITAHTFNPFDAISPEVSFVLVGAVLGILMVWAIKEMLSD